MRIPTIVSTTFLSMWTTIILGIITSFLLFTISLYLLVIAYSAFLSNAIEFYVLASMVGAIQGGIQSISRSYYATLIPQDESGEYFGFYNMFGRAGAFMGPALVAVFVTFFHGFRSAKTAT